MIFSVDTDPSLMREGGSEPAIIRVNKFTEQSARMFAEDVARAHNTGQPFIPIMIDSYGGSIYSLMSMIDTIESSNLPIMTIVSGKAMSCGAVLFTCGDKGMRFMGKNATLMIHDAMSIGKGIGKAFELEADANEIKRLNLKLWAMMEKNIGKKPGFLWRKAHAAGRADLYISAEQAVEWGLASRLGIPHWKVNIKVEHHVLFKD